jgi:hypothetical protein
MAKKPVVVNPDVEQFAQQLPETAPQKRAQKRKPAPRRTSEASALTAIAETLLGERQQKLDDAASKERSRQYALKTLHATEASEREKRAAFQRVCDHLLGNHRIGVKPRDPMSALHKHYECDDTVRIHCSKCRWDWYPGDGKKLVERPTGDVSFGQTEVVENPTGKSWRDINKIFYEFANANELTSRAFQMKRSDPMTIEKEEAQLVAKQAKQKQSRQSAA